MSLLEVYSNNYLNSSNMNNDEDTDFQTALHSANTTMPNPGSGTGNAGDTPQEVVFLVTDGVDDVFDSSQPSPGAAPAAEAIPATAGNLLSIR